MIALPIQHLKALRNRAWPRSGHYLPFFFFLFQLFEHQHHPLDLFKPCVPTHSMCMLMSVIRPIKYLHISTGLIGAATMQIKIYKVQIISVR